VKRQIPEDQLVRGLEQSLKIRLERQSLSFYEAFELIAINSSKPDLITGT